MTIFAITIPHANLALTYCCDLFCSFLSRLLIDQPNYYATCFNPCSVYQCVCIHMNEVPHFPFFLYSFLTHLLFVACLSYHPSPHPPFCCYSFSFFSLVIFMRGLTNQEWKPSFIITSWWNLKHVWVALFQCNSDKNLGQLVFVACWHCCYCYYDCHFFLALSSMSLLLWPLHIFSVAAALLIEQLPLLMSLSQLLLLQWTQFFLLLLALLVTVLLMVFLCCGPCHWSDSILLSQYWW